MFIVTRVDEIGGAQIHVRDVACRLSSEGNSVWVISGDRIDKKYKKQLIANGIVFTGLRTLKRAINPLTDIFTLVKIIKIIRKIKPDIVSLHSSKAGFIGRVAAYITATRSIFTAHGWSFSEGVRSNLIRFYILLERLASKLTDRIVTVSCYDKELALKNRIAPKQKIVVIHNAVLDISPKKIAKPELSPCRIVMTARFAPPKDHIGLLNTLKDIRHLDWRLDLVGKGVKLNSIKQLVDKYELNDRTTFHGQTNRVEEILGKSSMFVLVTDWEGLPRSIIEAMRAGLPIVASKVGGISELVKNGENGYLVKRRNYAELRKKMLELIVDSTKRKKMGKISRMMYEKKYKFDEMYKKTLDLYKELLN